MITISPRGASVADATLTWQRKLGERAAAGGGIAGTKRRRTRASTGSTAYVTLPAMGAHTATIHWAHSTGSFQAGSYSREHTWSFDGGLVVPASPSPHVVRVPYSNPACVDPEEAFVAAIASCHMLSFLYAAQQAGFEVAQYDDEAVGRMTKNEQRVSFISDVLLSPRIVYAGERRPTPEQEDALHAEAHHACFIANSVKTDIRVKPERG